MKVYCKRSTTGPVSVVANSTGKLYLPVLWCAVLVSIICNLVFSGCAGDASDSDSETLFEASGNAAEWAFLYDAQLPLYYGRIPNSIPYYLEETSSGEAETIDYYNVSVPTLSVFLPPDDVATGAAVIICPGGGYHYVACGSGFIVAEALAEHGIAAFVLKYRLPNDLIMVDKTIGPLQDAQQAIKMVRQRAAQWGIDPEKVGIMGHSAGGHLAATAGTHYDETYISNGGNMNLRPDFMILVSSVISMEEGITHQGSRENLLGENPDASLVENFSNELQVTPDTPPAYIAHAENDSIVPIENATLFFEALAEFGIAAQTDQYATGGHGFVVDVSPDGWMASLLDWLEVMGMIPSE